MTLLVIAVPEQLATSRLAGMPPITGFYAFVAGTVLFALLGSNPQMSVGADSTIAPLFAVGIMRLAPAGSPHYVDLVGILAVMVGVIVALIGLLRLGWIAEFLSAPIITGFLAGVAVIIVVHQLPDLFGLALGQRLDAAPVSTVVSSPRPTPTARRSAIGAAVFAVVVAAERIDRKLPGALVGLVGSTLVVGRAGLHGHGVAILGAIAHGAPRLGLFDLSWSTLGSVAPIAASSRSSSSASPRPPRAPSPTRATTRSTSAATSSASAPAASPPACSAPSRSTPARPRTAATASAGGRTQAAGLAPRPR